MMTKDGGSSPLARGLRPEEGGVRPRRRIIPTRAGFTGSLLRRALASRDHPRSRGVYANIDVEALAAAGSSPLARGLPWAHESDFDTAGIIPARAGFTRLLIRPPSRAMDHPRSRGVYSVYSGAEWFSWGSSPLARGLPWNQATTTITTGIIPARAGFTASAPPRSRCASDHPRSRGVYAVKGLSHPLEMGSSPLARGLLTVMSDRPWSVGIIPARAGFTSRTMEAIWSLHGSSPLARGLRGAIPSVRRGSRIIPARAGFTPAGVLAVAEVAGSSPLARGLPPLPMSRAAACRIIPARAGFTTWSGTGVTKHADHPRSRGVYDMMIVEDLSRLGSSPLARGLRVAELEAANATRIIPARAGFTGPASTCHSRSQDHPRSRGVYFMDDFRTQIPVGSSPLARGLPHVLPGEGLHGRIIPARAGFTSGWRKVPRCFSGSSPLARGLRGNILGAVTQGGIIPARAGFTITAMTYCAHGRDHPRSRGVYDPRVPGRRVGRGSSPLARGLLP